MLSFSLLFTLASLSKFQYRERFKLILSEYQLLPKKTVAVFSTLIPSLEFTVALALLIPTVRELAAIAGTGLLLLYAIAMSINIQRGQTQMDCGCQLGSSEGKTLISKSLVARNIIMAIGLLLIFIPATARTLNPADFALIGFGLCILSVSYATLNQLITNHYRYQEML